MQEGMAVASGPGGVTLAAIANGQTVGAAIDLGNKRLARMDFPAAFDGTSVSFQVSPDNNTFTPLYKDDGTLYAPVVAQGHSVAVDLTVLASVRYLKLVAGTAQTGDRVVTLATIA